jgi:magnesium-transporting ATPase (P-type)
MPEPVVVGGAKDRPRERASGGDRAWIWVGWFGLVLSVVGLVDFALTWMPPQLGTPEWEFGTIAASFAGLPLVTMGFAALLGSALAREVRWQLFGMSAVLLGMSLFLIAALIVFVLVVPVALAAVEGPARIGILKAIVRTAVLGLAFLAAYAAAGVGALRRGREL